MDIGNTNTVLGVYNNDILINSWRINSTQNKTIDEYWIVTKLFCDNANIDIHALEGVIIGSVVPNLTLNFEQMVKKYLQIKIIIVNHKINLGFGLKVDIPANVGADRICNVSAARENYPKPSIVVDLGTATTFDVIDDNGDYIGGAIAPGIYTGSTELTRKAAKLSKINLKNPKHYIGTNTEEHLLTGIFIGHIAMIEGLITRMKKEYKGSEKFTIIATGGLSQDIADNCKIIDKADINLTLEGLKILYKQNIS